MAGSSGDLRSVPLKNTEIISLKLALRLQATVGVFVSTQMPMRHANPPLFGLALLVGDGPGFLGSLGFVVTIAA
jgi:hypothetical protein